MSNRGFTAVVDIHQRAVADLLTLADRCEAAGPDEQAEVIAQAGFLAADYCRAACGPEWQGRIDAALHFARLGASETAVLAFIPPEVNLTAGVLAGRTELIAQAVVPGHGGSHSRQARSLAMAWLAAFLRALANPVRDARHAD